jgi:hypothetical protein
MEWFLIALTSLLMVISPVGLVVDQVIDHNIRDRVKSVEELSVRVDNAPSFQIIKGKVNRVRIASRGLEPLDHVRIQALELETDPIDISLDNLKINNLQELRASLHKPLQGAIHVVMTPEDINNALADEEIKAKLQDLLNKVLPEEAPKLEVVNIKVTFLDNNRLQTQVQLQQKSEDSEPPDQLKIVVETGIKVNQGKSLELIDPTPTFKIGSVSDRLDLSRFENQGIIARLLKLEINPQEINIAAFIRLNPVNPL